MRKPTACTSPAWDFSRAEEFWARFEPLTPYGKDEKEARLVLADQAAIERLYDLTEAALAYLEAHRGEGATLDRVSHHLRRMPRLPLEPRGGAAYDLVEIFQIKKFLSNYRALLGLLDEQTRAAFGFPPEPRALCAELDKGGSDAETFYIADSYDPRLKETRSRIASLDARLAVLRAESRARAAKEAGLDFAGREFLVVSRASASALVRARAHFSVEPYDAASYIVRLQPGDEELELEAGREALRDEERKLEEGVLESLSRMIEAELSLICLLVDAARDFDLARARALLVREYRLTRPLLRAQDHAPSCAQKQNNGQRAIELQACQLPPLEVEEGRFLPCAWECERLGLRYSPLDFSLSESAAVLFGSNMGGKTVALESVVFFQVLAQAGFFVPAKRYASSVYPRIHYVGELKGRRVGEARGTAASLWRLSASGAAGGTGGGREGVPAEGLSGFGFEIRAFVEAWEDASGGALVVFDEFARTTSSREAEAILSAALEALSRLPASRTLFSTHFHGVARLPGVRYLRVRGLDRKAACEALGADEPLGERIRRINGMMRYGLVEDRGDAPEGSDAVAIAALLGLDPGIVARAEELYAEAPCAAFGIAGNPGTERI